MTANSIAASEGPRPRSRVLLISIYDIYAPGLRSLQAQLIAAGHDCDLLFFQDSPSRKGFQYTRRPRTLDYFPTEEEYDLLGAFFRERRPSAVGIGFMSYALKWAKRITEAARAAGVPLVVWGGSHPTLEPEECIKVADVVCVGEGEEAMLELADSLASGRPLQELENLWVREGDRVWRKPIRPLIQDLDRLRPPIPGPLNNYLLARNRLENRDPYLDPGVPLQYIVIGSRGCPFHCSFCCNTALAKISRGRGKFVRQRSTDNILSEIKSAQKVLSLHSVGFQDENFSSRPGFYEDFFSRYRAEIGLPFLLELHPRTVSPEFCAAMRQAGGVVAGIGVQSGSEPARREIYARPETNAEILAAARAISDQGILLYADFIFNNPFETREDLERTLELILALPRPHVLKMYSLCYLPGAPITERALAQGKITSDRLDHHSQQGFLQMMATYHNARDREHAFYITLCWLENLKLDLLRLEVDFSLRLAEDGPRAFHLIPRWLIRVIARSRFLHHHPRVLHLTLSSGLPAANLILSVLRRLRTLFRLLRQGQWKKISSRLRGLLSPRTKK